MLFPSFPSPAFIKDIYKMKMWEPQRLKEPLQSKSKTKSSDLEPTGSTQRSFIFTGDSVQDWAGRFPMSLGLKTEDAAWSCFFLSIRTCCICEKGVIKKLSAVAVASGGFLLFVLSGLAVETS